MNESELYNSSASMLVLNKTYHVCKHLVILFSPVAFCGYFYSVMCKQDKEFPCSYRFS